MAEAGDAVTPRGTTADLRTLLDRLDGRGYRAFKDITGAWRADGYTLHIDHVQGDPFAEPSRIRVTLPPATAALPPATHATPVHALATADFLNRRLATELARHSRSRGPGQSGQLRVLEPGQQVLRRSSLYVTAAGAVEARFRAGLPARGRTALGREAADMLLGDVHHAALASLVSAALDPDALARHVDAVLDARALRGQLEAHGLVAFVADGARLPRRSGVDDAPLADDVTTFESPAALRVELLLADGAAIPGMGVPAGVTLIVGGGFHGKSTLLRALERGVYDHIPGDGRERVVTRADAVKVRAEDGRSVAGTDISNFIGTLPGDRPTHRFVTANASGSTSQAASIVEALEAGARCLLLDEDTSATNFMIRDARMQALIARRHEPITPYIDRARQLADALGVSSVIVVGGAGDYFDVADTVIALREYVPAEVTADARRVAAAHPTARRAEAGEWRTIGERVPDPASLDPSLRHRAVHVRACSDQRALFGAEEVELSAVEQLVEAAQARAIALAIASARGGAIDGRRPLRSALDAIMACLDSDGLDAFQDVRGGELAEFRIFELTAFVNRIRTLAMR